MESEERMQAIYDIHSGPLIRTILVWTYGDWQAAEDLLQETMVRAWHKIDILNPDPAILRPWLLLVARRISIDRFRARTARPAEVEIGELECIGEPTDAFDQILDRQFLRCALYGLSTSHREALVHVYLLDRTVPEAAAALGVPEGTVKSRLHHALRAVRGVVEVANGTSAAVPEPELVAG